VTDGDKIRLVLNIHYLCLNKGCLSDRYEEQCMMGYDCLPRHVLPSAWSRWPAGHSQ